MVSATTIDELRAVVGRELGATQFRKVTQADVDAFGELTGDRQWIHTDPARARDSPFGGTIAHGYYTLALAPAMLAEVLPLDGFAAGVNYGLDRVRFPAPMRVGAAVRMRAELDAVEEIEGGASLRFTLTFETQAIGKPVCVAVALYRVFEHAGDGSR